MLVSNVNGTPRKMFVNDEMDVKMMYLLVMDDGDDIGRSSSMQQQLPPVQCFTKDERRMLALSTSYDTPNVILPPKTKPHSKAIPTTLVQKRRYDIKIVHMQINEMKKDERDIEAIGKTKEMETTKKKANRSGSKARQWFYRFVANLRFAQTVHVV